MKAMPQLKAVMTPFPHSVELDAPLDVVRQFMQERQIRHLPVTREHELIGIVTDRDIKLVLGPDFDYPSEAELKVRDAYIPEAYVVDLHEPLDSVLSAMAERHIGSVIVTRKGKLAGIFTVTDACRSFAEYLRQLYRPGGGNEAA